MHRRTSVGLTIGSFMMAAACSTEHAVGPGAPTCRSALASQIALAVGAYTSLDPAADSGCATFPANSSAVDSAEYLIVPQSAAGTFGDSSPFALRTAVPAASAALMAHYVTPPSSPRSAAVEFDGFLRRLGRTRAFGTAAPAPPMSGPARAAIPLLISPPTLETLRTFVVCASLTCNQFQHVTARAMNVGLHIAIYVDTLAPTGGLDSADLDTLKQVFDSRLYPLDTATFGGVSDIDSNSVVIVLMTNVVNKLVTSANCTSTGFIAGFFLSVDLDLTAPADSSNHGEIFYSIVADSAGTLSCAHNRAQVKRLIPATFTHEFQHMINFVQHVLVNGSQAEEGWLDEGLSKYAEELAGRSYLQQGDTATFSQYAFDDVYDGYQYLSATGSSPLLIQYDQGTLAEVGASWLFVRYLVDQFGTSLPHELDGTRLVGSANVAAQTGQSFTTSVTRWALANWVSDDSVPGFVVPAELKYTSWHFRRTFASLHAQDPAHFPLLYPVVPATSAGSAVNLSGTLRSGSGVYLRALQGPGAPAFTLLLNAGSTPLPTGVVPRLDVIRIR